MADNLSINQQTAEIENVIIENGNQTNNYIFNWTLDTEKFKNSIFEKIKTIEIVDIRKIYGFINTEMGINYGGIARYQELYKNYKDELEQITNYKNLYDSKKKCFKTGYHLTKHKWGRISPFNYLSLCIMHRPTRHSLADDNYIDIDMVNAQPVLVSEICKHHNINVQYLNHYIKNRDEVFNLVMTNHLVPRDVAKNLFITLMFGGSYDGWTREHNIINGSKLEIVENIEKETKTIMEIVYNANKHIETAVLKQDPQKWKNANEKKRGVMALWAQSVERLIQETAIKFLVENRNLKLEEIVPCQDGFMILKNYYYDEIINDIENIILEKYNININFKVKPFDEKINIPIEASLKSPYTIWDNLISKKELAKRFIKEFGFLIKKDDNNFYVFWGEQQSREFIINGRTIEKFTNNMQNPRWYIEDNRNNDKFRKLVKTNLYYLIWEELANVNELSEEEYNKLHIKLRELLSGCQYENIMEKDIFPDIERINKKFDSDPMLLGFENGIYDLITHTFRPHNYNDLVTMSTGYNFEEVNYGEIFGENNEIIDIIDSFDEYEKIKIRKHRENRDLLIEFFESIMPDIEEREYLLVVLASGLDGIGYQKFNCLCGRGGNGKSTLSYKMQAVLGSYFLIAKNSILTDNEKSNSASPDNYLLKNKRYVVFQELEGDIKNGVLKNICGGGELTARLLNKNNETFKINATFGSEFNEPPVLTGRPTEGDYRRINYFDFIVNFTTDTEKIGKTLGNTIFKKANSKFGNLYPEQVKIEFLHMLLNVYKTFQNKDDPRKGLENKLCNKEFIPRSIVNKSKQFVANFDLFRRVFNELFEIVEIEKDLNGRINKEDKRNKTIKLKDIYEEIKQSEDFKSIISSRDKKFYGRAKFDEFVDENLRHHLEDNNNIKYIVGIKRKDNELNITLQTPAFTNIISTTQTMQTETAPTEIKTLKPALIPNPLNEIISTVSEIKVEEKKINHTINEWIEKSNSLVIGNI